MRAFVRKTRAAHTQIKRINDRNNSAYNRSKRVNSRDKDAGNERIESKLTGNKHMDDKQTDN